MNSVALGFVKQAGIGGMIGRTLMKPKVLAGGALLGGGATAGVMGAKALQRPSPLADGALNREKRRAEMDRYGTI